MSHGPCDGGDEQAEEEHREETRKHNMEGLAFFLHNFFADGSLVWVDGLMIVILNALENVRGSEASKLNCPARGAPSV